MRLTTVILIASLMQLSAAGLAQRVTLKEKEAPLKTVIQKITAQTGFDFIADFNLVAKAKSISIDVHKVPLEEVLNQIFKNQQIEYQIKDQFITLKEKSLFDRLSSTVKAILKNIDVKGKVVDQDGKPLPNASIRVKGKNTVTNTNQNGEFEIKDVADDAVLLISYVGFKTLELPLKDAITPLEIKLNVQTGELEEVNVTYSTGYQNIPKERATGSFVQIDNETINRGVSTNILDRIAYLTSGLRKGNNGLLSSDITIRGLSTISANAKPLIVIDEFPYEEYAVGMVSLNNLNPNDVESVTILRDAAAASIWGARSANGVIVITTKKGKFNQRTSISFNGNTTITEVPDLFKINIMSSKDAIDYERKLFAGGYYNDYNGPFPANYGYPAVSPAIEIMLAQKRGAITQAESEKQLIELANHDTRNDINKYLLRTGLTQQYSFSVSGGSEKMNYYSSVGYNTNIESEVGNRGNALTVNLNNTYRPIKNLQLNTYLNYVQSKNKANGISYNKLLASGSNMIAPYTMLADQEGNPLHVPLPNTVRLAYIDTIKTKGLLDWHYRPLDELNNQDNIAKAFNLRFGGALNYTFLPGLSIDLKGQYNRTTSGVDNYQNLRNYYTRNFINSYMYLNAAGQPQYPVPLNGILDYSNRTEAAYNLRALLSFNKKLDIHSIAAISGFDIGESKNDSNNSRRYGYDPYTLSYATNMDYVNLYAIRPTGNNGRLSETGGIEGFLIRNYSYYSNFNYTLLNRYTLTASGRIDAANLFGMKANLKAKPTWSVGMMWDIVKEDFFNVSSISSLNIRATYGYNGNVDNSSTSLPVVRYSINNSPTYQLPQQFASLVSSPNPGMTWEKVRVVNLALDFGLFRNRLTGSLEYYTKRIDNLIAQGSPADPTLGITSYKGNFGGLKGNGIDFSLKGLIVDNSMKLRTNFNISYNTDEITNYYLDPNLYRNASSYIQSILLVGKPISKLYSYPWAGLNSQTGDPMGIVNGQVVPFVTALGALGTADRDLIYHGRSTPSVIGNMMTDISYRGFSASFNITYEFGFYFRRPSIDFNTLQSNWNGHGDYSLRWQKPGDELLTNVPSMPISADARYSFYSNSEILVERGDHIRLRDLRLSYSLNKTKQSPFSNIGIALTANNLNVILWRANKSGTDPGNINSIPLPRSLTFGLTFNF